MKLLYFSGSTLPSTYANAVHVMKMCSAFAEECGHDVTLFAKYGAQKDTDIFKSYDVSPAFKVKRSPHIKVPVLSGLLRIAYALGNKKGADIIYGRDMWSMALISHSKTPLVFELHEIPRSALQKQALRKILHAKNLRGVVVITEGLKQDLMAFAPTLDPAHILVAHDGADMPKQPIQPYDLAPIPQTSIQVGYGGSLYKGKGVDLLINIARIAPHIGFHIFGGPSSELENWRTQNPPDNIKFYGHLPHGELKSRLGACDVLAAPYQPVINIGTGADIARWISPLKLFEYMAIEKPILCSNLPILCEVMTHESNCLLAAPTDEQDWIHAIDRLAQDPELSTRIATQALVELKQTYSWAQRAKTIHQAFFETK